MARPPLRKMSQSLIHRIRCFKCLHSSTRPSLVTTSSTPISRTRSTLSSASKLSPATKPRLIHTSPPLSKVMKNIPGKTHRDEKIPPYYLHDEPPPYCHTCGRIMSYDSAADLAETERKYCSGGCRRRKPRRKDMEIEETFVNFLKERGEGKLVSCDEVEQFYYGDVEDMVKFEGDKRHIGEIMAKNRERIRQAARRGVVFGFVKYNGLARWPKCEVVQEGVVVEPSFAKGDFSIRWRGGE